MHPSASAQFYPEMLLLEASAGPINWLYFDTHKPNPLATTGLGSMLDAGGKLTAYGLALPWRKKSGAYATEAEIAAEYSRLAALGISSKGGYAYKSHAALFLDDEVVQWDFGRKRDSMEANVAGFLPGWESLRADAQLAAMSMVWNVGENMFNPGSRAYWPTLSAALKAEDYVRASDTCLINAKTSERNRRNRRLFLHAARAVIMGEAPDRLFGPRIKVSASHIVNGNPAKPGSHAFFAQAIMRASGHYTLKLDGLFGPRSHESWKAATGEDRPTKAGLDKLVEATRWTLGAEAGA